MSEAAVTLTRHLLMQERSSVPPGELAMIMEQLARAAKMISQELGRAGLLQRLGYSGETNVQGEQVKKLDTFSNEVFLNIFADSYPVSTLVSEEMEAPQFFAHNSRRKEHNYAVLFDPLDGSSNTDVNGSLGTIFSIRRRKTNSATDFSDLLRPGREQVAAGYVLYGPSTMLVYGCGSVVNGFTLDRGMGEFLLSHPSIRTPERGGTYSVNQGRYDSWHAGARRLVDSFRQKDRYGKIHSLRYCGAFVADFHRCLLEGGVFLYPSEVGEGGKSSPKLRLMYEIAPMALIAEQAGGRASSGRGPVLDLTPKTFHERAPIYIGSAEEVTLAEKLRVED